MEQFTISFHIKEFIDENPAATIKESENILPATHYWPLCS